MTRGESWTEVVGRLVRRLLSAVESLDPLPIPRRKARNEPRKSPRHQSVRCGQRHRGRPTSCTSTGQRQQRGRKKQGTRRRPQRNTGHLGPNAETVYLVIGLDFGTSCTKVVVQNPFAHSAVTAVPWNLGNGPKHLLPTALYENSEGEFALVPDGEPVRCRRDLKVDLMDHVDDEDARGRAAAYLGLVLRRARQWLLEDQQDVYGKFPHRVGTEHRDSVRRIR